ncbi:hypothetical protein [Gordonia terrae]
MDFDELIERFGGVVATHQLLAAGETTASIRDARRSGRLTSIRHGWYRTPTADPEVVGAVADDGVVSCASALRRHGLWIPEHPAALHSRVTRHQRRRSHDRCRRSGRPTPARGAVDDVATALQYAARCFDVEGFVILCDSALNSGKITPERLRAEFDDAPMFIRRAIGRTNRLAASGTETAARLRLESAGLRVAVQHRVPGSVGSTWWSDSASRSSWTASNTTPVSRSTKRTQLRPSETDSLRCVAECLPAGGFQRPRRH